MKFPAALARLVCPVVAIVTLAMCCGSVAVAQDKIILLEDASGLGALFEVSDDGSKIYFAADGRKFAVFDDQGKVIDRIGAGGGGAPREIVPLPDGWFIVAIAHSNGQITLYRPDGSEAKVLVSRGSTVQTLKADM